MGQPFSLKAKNRPLSTARISNLSILYHSKIYSENKKSLEDFRKEIEALVKKTSYLSYSWAQAVHKDLSCINADKLYSQYQAVLQENCRRDGRNEIIFYASKIRTAFINEITGKYKLKNSTLDVARLKALILECKNYFMVMSWFHKVSSLGEARCKEEEGERDVLGKFGQEERVFSLLVESAGKTYVQYLQKEQISKIWGFDYQGNPEYLSQEMMKHLKTLRECRKFQEKEGIIAKMQELLCGQGMEEGLEIIQKVVGRSQIFAHLLVIRQLGSIDIAPLWARMYGAVYDELLK